jgi:RNA polymerase sigma factor (sigma-70 family)
VMTVPRRGRRRLRVSRAKSHSLADLDGAPAEQIAMLHLEHQDVVIALRGLPRRQREVLVLRFYEDATEAEIAETLGITAGSVKTHASRGLHAVADLLEGSA